MSLKFVTREHPKVDRVACAWLIKKFIDPSASLLFVPRDEVLAVAEHEGALPYDVPGVDLGHHEGGSSFDAFVRKYDLTDPALHELAKIIRAADTRDPAAAPEAEGVRQMAHGWHLLEWGLEKRLEIGFALFDSLYAVCQDRVKQTILFICPHHAAKSVIAEAYFNQQARVLALPFRATSAGTEPDATVSPVVVALLAQAGIDVARHQPRQVTPTDLQTAVRIISMGCTPRELSLAPEQVELWNDVPAVSEAPEQAQDAIRSRIEALLTELRGR